MQYEIKEFPKVKHDLDDYPILVQKLLLNRGITSKKEADVFLNPDFNKNHDPFLMKDMEKAVARILSAIEKNEKILIYSDFDADGIPGGALLKEFFDLINYQNVSNYIPHRHDEGYGFHLEAVEQFAKDDVRLIITIDVGISSAEQVKKAHELGMEVIVTDHHEVNGNKPEALAVLNPKQKDCKYPDKMLCGAGVAYKLVQGILSKNRFDLKEGKEKWLLDLAGLATLSDMVPLVGENRLFAYYGLKVLQKSRRPGFLHLFKKLRMKQNVLNEDDVTFMITPRINAASRMGHPDDAFNLLVEKDDEKAVIVAEHLDGINNERKGVVASLVKEIKKQLGENPDELAIVAGNPEWKPALLGLVASSLVEKYNRPVFLWGRENGDGLKGSCRSDGSVDLVKFMESIKDSFIQFGGHKMAGGFSVSSDQVHHLKENILNGFDNFKTDKVDNTDYVDEVLNLDEVNLENYNNIEKLAPFGVGNLKPTFLFKDLKIVSVEEFGKQKNHLKLVFQKSNGDRVSAVKFFAQAGELKDGDTISLVAHIEKDTFSFRPEIRLRIVAVF